MSDIPKTQIVQWLKMLQQQSPNIYEQINMLRIQSQIQESERIIKQKMSCIVKKYQKEMQDLIIPFFNETWMKSLSKIVKKLQKEDKKKVTHIQNVLINMEEKSDIWSSLSGSEKSQMLQFFLFNLDSESTQITKCIWHLFNNKIDSSVLANICGEGPKHTSKKEQQDVYRPKTTKRRKKQLEQNSEEDEIIPIKATRRQSFRNISSSSSISKLMEQVKSKRVREYFCGKFLNQLSVQQQTQLEKVFESYMNNMIQFSELRMIAQGYEKLDKSMIAELGQQMEGETNMSINKNPRQFYDAFPNYRAQQSINLSPSYWYMYPQYPTSQHKNKHPAIQGVINYQLLCIEVGNETDIVVRKDITNRLQDYYEYLITKKHCLTKYIQSADEVKLFYQPQDRPNYQQLKSLSMTLLPQWRAQAEHNIKVMKDVAQKLRYLHRQFQQRNQNQQLFILFTTEKKRNNAMSAHNINKLMTMADSIDEKHRIIKMHNFLTDNPHDFSIKTEDIIIMVNTAIQNARDLYENNSRTYTSLHSKTMHEQCQYNPYFYHQYIDSKNNHPFMKIRPIINQTISNRVYWLTQSTDIPIQEIQQMRQPYNLLQMLNIIPPQFCHMSETNLQISKQQAFVILDFADRQIFEDVWLCVMLYLPYLNQNGHISSREWGYEKGRSGQDQFNIGKRCKNQTYQIQLTSKLSAFFQVSVPNTNTIAMRLSRVFKNHESLKYLMDVQFMKRCMENTQFYSHCCYEKNDKDMGKQLKEETEKQNVSCHIFDIFKPPMEDNEKVIYCQFDENQKSFISFSLYLHVLYELAVLAVNKGIVERANLKYILLGLTWGRIITESSKSIDAQVYLFKLISDYLGQQKEYAYILDVFSRILSYSAIEPQTRGPSDHKKIFKLSLSMFGKHQKSIYQTIKNTYKGPIAVNPKSLSYQPPHLNVLRTIFKKHSRKMYINLAWQRQLTFRKTPTQYY